MIPRIGDILPPLPGGPPGSGPPGRYRHLPVPAAALVHRLIRRSRPMGLRAARQRESIQASRPSLVIARFLSNADCRPALLSVMGVARPMRLILVGKIVNRIGGRSSMTCSGAPRAGDNPWLTGRNSGRPAVHPGRGPVCPRRTRNCRTTRRPGHEDFALGTRGSYALHSTASSDFVAGPNCRIARRPGQRRLCPGHPASYAGALSVPRLRSWRLTRESVNGGFYEGLEHGCGSASIDAGSPCTRKRLLNSAAGLLIPPAEIAAVGVAGKAVEDVDRGIQVVPLVEDLNALDAV